MSDLGRLVPRGGGDEIPLLRPKLTIGRRDSCDICLEFSNISSVHCEMTFRNGCWILEDKNSKNGVKVNGDRVQRKVLHPGDAVSIAKHDFTIEYNMPTNSEALEELMEEVEGIIEKPLLEKAGLLHPPKSGPRPRPGGLNLPPLPFIDDDDDGDD